MAKKLKETTRLNITHWTGLTGLDLDNIIRYMDEQGIDAEQGFDWKTLGEDAPSRDYKGIMKQLRNMYAYVKPLSQEEISISIDKADKEEAESMMNTKEGVKELLRRIYIDPLVSKKKKDYYKNILLETNPAGLATAIALYNGEAKDWAKRFLGEEIVPVATHEVKKIMEQKKYVRLLTSEGMVKSIDGRYLKEPVKATEFVAQTGECEPVPGSGERVAVGKNKDGTIKWGYFQIYSCKREPPVTLKPIDPNLKVDPNELYKGIEIEKEHTEDWETARKIAMHHLAENKFYYTYLEKMEKEMAEAKKEVEPTMIPILKYIHEIPITEVKMRAPQKIVSVEEPQLYVGIPTAKLTELDQKYSSQDIMQLARVHRIKIGKKTDMITALVQKGVAI